MNKNTINLLCQHYNINKTVIDYVNLKEEIIIHKFKNIDKIKEYNQYKIIKSMQDVHLGSNDFNWTTGYGYGDVGREKVEKIYSSVFNTEDALVRPIIVSGTHALSLTLSGLLRPNDEFISITGRPYDTLQEVIGIKDKHKGSLLDYNILYKEIHLINDKIDVDQVISSITAKTKLLLIQRSTGYSDRKAIPLDEMKIAIEDIKSKYKDIIIMVDNCYGEFVNNIEPTDIGADIMAGSLIKNPGGGLALSGGYIVGKKDFVKEVANRATAPGLGKDCGLTFGTTRTVLQGFFLAPHIVAEAIKGAILMGAVYKSLGFEIIPELDDTRSDIIQAIKFEDEDRIVEFCKGIQSASPVDSFATPIPWEMPGYKEKVIMAAGGFVEGSSIELSADAPIRQPYYAYYQGGLTYEHCKLGVIKSLNNLFNNNLIDKNKLILN